MISQMVWEPRLSLTHSSDGDKSFEVQASQKQPWVRKGFPAENPSSPCGFNRTGFLFHQVQMLWDLTISSPFKLMFAHHGVILIDFDVLHWNILDLDCWALSHSPNFYRRGKCPIDLVLAFGVFTLLPLLGEEGRHGWWPRDAVLPTLDLWLIFDFGAFSFWGPAGLHPMFPHMCFPTHVSQT